MTLKELREATNQLYDHLGRSVGKEIEVPDVFYWAISSAARRDQYDEPTEFTLGQTSEDVRELRRIASRETDPMGLGLVWLAAVLREVGEEYPG